MRASEKRRAARRLIKRLGKQGEDWVECSHCSQVVKPTRFCAACGLILDPRQTDPPRRHRTDPL